MHLAMLRLPRVEDRITALFADLAEPVEGHEGNRWALARRTRAA